MITADDLLDELAQELSAPEIPDGAITVTMLYKRGNKSREYVRQFLEGKVNDGLMECITINNAKWYYPK
jgi:hypothetical protein